MYQIAIHLKKKKNSNGPDENYGLAEPLSDFLSDDEFQIKKLAFIQSITLSEASKVELELETRNQSKNQRWFEERRKRLSASNFGKVCKMRPYTSCKVTVHDILYGCINTSATEYGIKTEEQALRQLEMEIKKKILKCGLFVDKNIPYLAATPGKIVYYSFYFGVEFNVIQSNTFQAFMNIYNIIIHLGSISIFYIHDGIYY